MLTLKGDGAPTQPPGSLPAGHAAHLEQAKGDQAIRSTSAFHVHAMCIRYVYHVYYMRMPCVCHVYAICILCLCECHVYFMCIP